MKKITTAREAAIDLIGFYVERSDTIEQLKASHLGSWNGYYHASIGGWKGEERISTDNILVAELNGKEVCEIFSLRKLFDEIKRGKSQMALF